MAFDFPDAPAIGDEYISGGATYTWTGLVWDLASVGTIADKVDKAGDTMTGPLNIDTVGSAGASLLIRSELGVRTISLNPSGTPHSGLIEFWDPAKPDTRKAYIGYGGGTDVASYYININPEGGKVHINGGGLAMQDGAGIHWGSTSAKTDVNDFSEGICLYGYGGTSQFGFNITSGTLNASVQNAVNKFDVNIGGANKLSIQNTTSYLNTNFTMTGLLTVNTGIALSSAYLSCPEGSKIQFNSASMFISSTANKNIRYDVGDTAEHGMWVNGTKEFWVSSAGHGLRMPDSFATGLGVTRDDDGGVNMRETLIALLAKIKSLEAEIATLKGAK